MKRILICAVMIALNAMVPAAALDMGAAFLFNYDTMKENGGFETIRSLGDLAFLGFFVDVPLGTNLGLRADAAVKFLASPGSPTPLVYDKNILWDMTVGPVYHILGYGWIDPYVQAGIGSAGGVFFDERALDWRTRVQLSVMVNVAAGFNLVLSNHLTIGVRVRTSLYEFNPSPLATFKQFPLAASMCVGVRL